MVARSLMLELHRAGHLELPAKRMSPPNNAVVHGRAASTAGRSGRRTGVALEPVPLEGSLGQLGPLEIQQVRRTPQEGLLDGLLQTTITWDILGPLGASKYLVYAGQPWLAWPGRRRRGTCDRAIVSLGGRRTAAANLHLLVYNTPLL